MFFSSKEEEAIQQINNINAEMRAIRVLMRDNGDYANKKIKDVSMPHIVNIKYYMDKYLKLKTDMSREEKILLLGRTVDVWNGEKVPVGRWEDYFLFTFERFLYSIEYCE